MRNSTGNTLWLQGKFALRSRMQKAPNLKAGPCSVLSNSRERYGVSSTTAMFIGVKVPLPSESSVSADKGKREREVQQLSSIPTAQPTAAQR